MSCHVISHAMISMMILGVTPPSDLHHNSTCVSYFAYDPSNPCPTIGGNLFGHGNGIIMLCHLVMI